MAKDEKAPYFVEQPFAVSAEPGFEKQTKNSKLASKPKIGETIVGDDGITGRMR